MNLILLLFGTFLLMCLARVPIAIALALSSGFTCLAAGLSPVVVVQNMYAGLDSYTLLAIPLFLLAGEIMERGSVTQRLVNLARTLVGHIRGSLGQVTVLSNMFMAGISGSAVADAAAIGGVMIPSMKKEGYPPPKAVAVTAASAVVGPLIPPSIIMVVYGAYGNVSIGDLFLGGAVPGILTGIGIMGVVFFWAGRSDFPRHSRATRSERWHALGDSLPALIAPIIVVGGIVGGIFTATESAMVAVLYTAAISVLIYRSLSIRNIWHSAREAFVSLANPLFCVSAAGAFGYVMAWLQVPELIQTHTAFLHGSATATLLFLVILYLIIGTFMDAIPAIIIFMPIVQKLVAAAAIDPVHAGVVVTTVLCFGFLTPPYGLTLLLCSGIGKTPIGPVVRSLLPVYGVMLGVIALVVFFPSIVLFLPNIFN